MNLVVRILEMPGTLLLAVVPVVIFLVLLVYIDSYKLVPVRLIVITLVSGAAGAIACFWANYIVLAEFGWSFGAYSRYGAPIFEELAKALVLVILIRRNRVGFLVDAAVLGFSVGTGFALVENLYYWASLQDSNWLIWFVRGFGTSLMHGGTTAIFAVLTKTLTDEKSGLWLLRSVPGILLAIVLHSFFNHFFLSPVIMSVLILGLLPAVFTVVFHLSEKSLQNWLGSGMDQDAEFLQLLHSGEFEGSRMGNYLRSLGEHFPGEVMVDLLCYMRLYTELSIRAKGLLMMREAGIDLDLEGDAELAANLEELRYLESSIGKAGRLALAPCLGTRGRDLWQLTLLKGAIGGPSFGGGLLQKGRSIFRIRRDLP